MASNKSPVLYFIIFVTQLKTYSYIQSMSHKKEFKYLRTQHKACVDLCFAATWPWSHNLSLWNHSKVHQPRVKHRDMSHEFKAVVQIPHPLGQQRCQMPRGDVEASIWPMHNWQLLNKADCHMKNSADQGKFLAEVIYANPPRYSRKLLVSSVSYQILEIKKTF